MWNEQKLCWVQEHVDENIIIAFETDLDLIKKTEVDIEPKEC